MRRVCTASCTFTKSIQVTLPDFYLGKIPHAHVGSTRSKLFDQLHLTAIKGKKKDEKWNLTFNKREKG